MGAFELQIPLAHLITFFPTNWYSLLQVTLATRTLPDSLIMFTSPFSTSGWMHKPVIIGWKMAWRSGILYLCMYIYIFFIFRKFDRRHELILAVPMSRQWTNVTTHKRLNNICRVFRKLNSKSFSSKSWIVKRTTYMYVLILNNLQNQNLHKILPEVAFSIVVVFF